MGLALTCNGHTGSWRLVLTPTFRENGRSARDPRNCPTEHARDPDYDQPDVASANRKKDTNGNQVFPITCGLKPRQKSINCAILSNNLERDYAVEPGALLIGLCALVMNAADTARCDGFVCSTFFRVVRSFRAAYFVGRALVCGAISAHESVAYLTQCATDRATRVLAGACGDLQPLGGCVLGDLRPLRG